MAYNTFSPIITNGLVFCLDAANNKSYPGIGLNWYDLKTVTPALLTNGAYYAPWNDGSISFDGLSDYVSTDFIPTIGVGDITYDVWFKTDTAQTGGIIGVRDTSAIQCVLVMSDSTGSSIGGNLLLYSYDGSVINSTYTTKTWNDGIWHNVVIVHSSTNQDIYVDGILESSNSSSSQNLNITSKLLIGCNPNGNVPLSGWNFYGSISNARVYDRALSSDEISYNYDAIKFRYLNNNTFPSITTSDLILNLDAGDLTSYSGSGPTWYDLTANSYDGTLTNGASFSSIGADNMGFDGTNDFVELGDVLDMGTYSYTINTWVKISATSSDQKFFSKSLSGTQNYRYAVGFLASAQKLWAFMQGNGGLDIKPYGSTTILPYQWFMATYVYDRGSNIKIYYNGVLETLTTSSTISSWNGLDFQSNNPARVGAYTAADNTSPIETTNGKIAISQIYRRALPASEILYNYNITKWRFLNDNLPPVVPIVTDQIVLNLNASDPVSYPGTGTTWFDLTLNTNDGTLTNGVAYNPVDGGVMIFDGVNDYVDFSTTNLSGTGDITIDTFLKLDGAQTVYANIFDYSHAGPPGLGGFVIQQNADAGVGSTNFYFAWWTGSTFDFCFFQVPLTNTYFHLVITKSGGSVVVYINSVSSFTGSGSSYLDGTGRVMAIGANKGGYGRYIKGTIGEFRIYSKALTAAEVLQNYNAQKSRYGL